MGAESACLFCRIAAGEIPATVVYENEHTLAFMDIAPASPGHVLVIPRAHATDLFDIPAQDLAGCAEVARRIAAQMTERLGAQGVNLLNSSGQAAWQTVMHFHLHVIPRYAGDPLRLPWTPKAGDPDEIAKVASELSGD